MKGMAILKNVKSDRAKETFYPTPELLADKLFEGIDWFMIESILEPSAGKGDLAMAAVRKKNLRSGWYNRSEAEAIGRIDIDCIEIDPVLRQTLEGKGFRVVHDNFLTFETQKRYSLIVMNPPFDQGDKHLLKALELTEHGGSIRCILNADTIRNPFSETRRQLMKKLNGYEAKIRYVSNAFSKAERRTDVEVALVMVDIPAKELDSSIMEDMRKAPTYKAQEIPEEYGEIIRYNAIDEWVNRYNFEAACGIKLIEEYEAMRRCMPLENSNVSGDSLLELKLHRYTEGDKTATVNNYLREVRGKYWRAIFQQPTFTNKLTYNLQQELYGYVKALMDYDFSAYNILSLLIKMNQKVIGGIEATILKLFDDWTYKHSWRDGNSPNRHYYDGWKTNDCFRVGKKVIIPFYGSYDSWSDRFRASNVKSKFSDIEKVFDFLDSGRTEWSGTVDTAFVEAEANQNTKNIDTKYFTVTFFKKGTAHFVFKDLDLLEKFNLFASMQKGWLPPNYGKKRYKDMTPEEKRVVDSFQGKEQYERVMDNAAYYLDAGKPQMLMIGAG